MSQLPHEIVSLIIQQLTTRRDLYTWTFINKAFHLVANPLLWRSPSIFNHEVTVRFLNCLKTTPYVGRYVRNLILCCSAWTDTELLLVMQHLPHLEQIWVQRSAKVTDTSLRQLPRHCPHLTSLHLSHVEITQSTMDALGQHCHQLTEIILNGCTGLGPDTFSALTRCPLQHLAMYYLGPGLATAKPVMDFTLAGNFDELTHLTLYDDQDDNNNFIHRLLSSAKAWPRMTSLTISSYRPHGHVPGLVPFLQSHPGTKNLDLKNGRYDDALLNAIADTVPQLTHVILARSENITHRSVRRLVQQCPVLRSVTLTGCQISAASFPEATNKSCRSQLGQDTMVRHLDEEATNKIRRLGIHGSGEMG